MVIKTVKVVCFGGGTGLSGILGGLKENPWLVLTAAVTMFDSGGSSGVLRDNFGILPPGDILKCMLALATDEEAARLILQPRGSSGHSSGNNLLLGLERSCGSFLCAVNELSEILRVKGRVLPVSLGNAHLNALYDDGTEAISEVSIDQGIDLGKKVSEISLDPQVEALPEVLEACREADVFIIGPGSLYTSVLPNFIPRGVKKVLAENPAPVILVQNLVTEGAGMWSMNCSDYLQCIEKGIGRDVTVVVVNNQLPKEEVLEKYRKEKKLPIRVLDQSGEDARIWINAPLWRGEIARHDRDALGHLLSNIIFCLMHNHELRV